MQAMPVHKMQTQ